MNREQFAQFLYNKGYRVGAEIGVEQGVYTETLCKAGLKIYAIDPWKAYRGYRDHVNQEKLDGFLEVTKEKFKGYNCEIIRKTSMEALKDIPDESLDFVYIDANHSFVYVAQDIYYWSRKVRKGGIVSGHDYKRRGGSFGLNSCHVKQVVDAWADINDIKILTTDERNPSWYYEKT